MSKLQSVVVVGGALFGALVPVSGAFADGPPPEEDVPSLPPVTTEEVGAAFDDPEGGSGGERCWRSDGIARVWGQNAVGQTTMWGEQRNDWCDKDGTVRRWLNDRNQEPSGSSNGWVWHATQADSGLTTTFPANVAYDRDDWHFRWLNSPIGAPQKHLYLDSQFRSGGRMTIQKGLA